MSIKPYDVMIDIETLGKKPGCVVLSVAAVSLHAQFYDKIKLESSYLAGLKVDSDTLTWWEKQDKAVYAEATSGVVSLHDVLLGLYSHLTGIRNANPEKKLRVWGNGASFDVPILEAAFDAVELEYPWTFRESMCYRTLSALRPEIQKPFKPYGTHSALVDARWQYEHLVHLLAPANAPSCQSAS